jgi:protein-S-isoprenylcysteine O-methyltransferase Ste14
MSVQPPSEPASGEASLSRGVARRMRQVVVTYVVLAALLFASSGRLGWVWAWAYLGAGLAILVVKRWDQVLSTVAGLPTLALPIVAGLDERFAWSPPLGLAVHLLGLAVYVLGQGLFSWAMASNKYFSTLVRIQMDRGQTGATGGPYRYVRHPGYTGYSVFSLGTSLALGSLWALIPAGLTACLLVVRTALEDRTLQEELAGYREYARRVRYRLLPGIW